MEDMRVEAKGHSVDYCGLRAGPKPGRTLG